MLIFHRANPTKIPQPKGSLMQYQHVVSMALLWKERGNQRQTKRRMLLKSKCMQQSNSFRGYCETDRRVSAG